MIAFFHDSLTTATRTELCGCGQVELPRIGLTFDLEATPAEVVRLVVSDFYGVGLSDLIGQSRVAHIAWARMVGMAMTREFISNFSLKAVGSLFRRKDHGTVLHAVKRIRNEEELTSERHGELLEVRRRIQDALDLRREMIRELATWSKRREDRDETA